MSADTRCRLCNGQTHTHFTEVILNKYSCQYLLCENCRSLQTERPFWLDEAYQTGNLADADTGAFMRCINNLSVIYLTSLILKTPKRTHVLDFGGGNGLLCRALRDVGFDARVSDRYARNDLARGFEDQGTPPDIMCSFEVAEHFPEPRTGMAEILGRGATICVVGTEVYRNQGKDWWYIAPQCGQHVFFYSHAGMEYLSKQHGYLYERVGSLHFFLSRPLGRWRSSLLWRGLQPGALRWVRAYLALRLSNRFADADIQTALRAAKAPPSS